MSGNGISHERAGISRSWPGERARLLSLATRQWHPALGAEPQRGRNLKQQAAGILLLALIIYPLTAGPFAYAAGRGWVPGPVAEAGVIFLTPADKFLGFGSEGEVLTVVERWHAWQGYCFRVGERYVSSADPPPAHNAPTGSDGPLRFRETPMIAVTLGIKAVMFVGIALLVVLVACGSRPAPPDRRSRDRFFARLADHGMHKGGPYIPFPPEDGGSV